MRLRKSPIHDEVCELLLDGCPVTCLGSEQIDLAEGRVTQSKADEILQLRNSSISAAEGTVQAWGRGAVGPFTAKSGRQWGWPKKGLRGRFAMYVPPVQPHAGNINQGTYSHSIFKIGCNSIPLSSDTPVCPCTLSKKPTPVIRAFVGGTFA